MARIRITLNVPDDIAADLTSNAISDALDRAFPTWPIGSLRVVAFRTLPATEGPDECCLCGARFTATRADAHPICPDCRKPARRKAGAK